MKIASLLFCIFAVFNQQSFASQEKYQKEHEEYRKAQEEYRKEQVCKKRLNTLGNIVKFVGIALFAGVFTHTTYHLGYSSGYYDGVQRGRATESNYILNDLAGAYNSKVKIYNMTPAAPSQDHLYWKLKELATYNIQEHYMQEYNLEQLKKERESR